MKGQVKLEFIFAIAFFGILLFVIATQVINANKITRLDSDADALKAKAVSIVTVLAEDNGEPENWEECGSDACIKRIGLAYSTFNLSKTKIMKLKNNCDLMKKFDVQGYLLIVTDSESELLLCGYGNVTPVMASVKKPVFIEGKLGSIALDMW